MNRKGSILIISLWILTLLVIFAVTIGHRSSLNLKLAKIQRDTLRADFSAQSGIQKAIAVLNKKSNNFNTLDEQWSTGKDPISGLVVLDNVDIKDEERYININGVTDFDKNRLEALLNALKIQDAADLAQFITDWKKNSQDFKAPQGEKKIEIPKKEDFKTPEELLAVFEYFYKQVKNDSKYKESCKETFEKIKDSITVVSSGRININTCSEDALNESIRPLLNQPNDADNLIQLIIKFRSTGAVFDKQDIEDIRSKLNITDDQQKNLLSQIINSGIISIKSTYFRINSTGKVNNITKKITAIYDTDNHKIVSWHQNMWYTHDNYEN